MLKPGKYLRSKNNGQIYPFNPADLANEAFEVVLVDRDGNVHSVDGEPQSEPVVEVKVLAVERGAVDVSEPERVYTRDELVVLYVERYGRKPHPHMREERLKQAVLAPEADDGNNHGNHDSQ